MAVANTVIQLKKSGISGNIPASLNVGETALNYADGKLFYKNSLGSISYIASTSSFATVNANSSLILATSPTDTLSFVGVNGISITTNTATKTIIISGDGSSSNGGSSGNSSGGTTVTITDDNTSNATRYVSFTDNTSGNVSTLYTSSQELTYNPSSGTLSAQALNVTPNVNISSGSTVLYGSSPIILDSFPVNTYRSAFYQLQLESGSSYHITNLNVLNSTSNAVYGNSGDVFNAGPLATFNASIVSGNVNVIITPVNSATYAIYSRKLMLAYVLGYPIGDLGYDSDGVTTIFDAGYDASSVTGSFDYGYLS